MPDHAMPAHAIAAPPPGLPLHLLLGAFPIVCFIGALVTDIVYANTADMQWANFSAWLLTAGLVTGALAILGGIVAYARDRSRGAGGGLGALLVHGVGTVAVMMIALINVLVHSRDAWTSVVPTGLELSVVTVVLMLLTGWLGGLLAYHRRMGWLR